MNTLADVVLEELEDQGFAIIPDFIRGERLRILQKAQRRILKTWEDIKEGPPWAGIEGKRAQDQVYNCVISSFPNEEMELYKLTVDPESIAFAQKWLKTEHIHVRGQTLIARYPGHEWGGTGNDDTGVHIDNGNNTLLPQTNTAREFGQLGFWLHLEDVDEDQAPIRLIPNRYGPDMSKCVPLVCRAGTLMLKTNYTWHSASAYTRPSGQRFSCSFSYGRADHCWENAGDYTSHGTDTSVFQQFIGGLSAREREFWRFPPVGHSYYTEETLALLENQYPGWNSDEYRSA